MWRELFSQINAHLPQILFLETQYLVCKVTFNPLKHEEGGVGDTIIECILFGT